MQNSLFEFGIHMLKWTLISTLFATNQLKINLPRHLVQYPRKNVSLPQKWLMDMKLYINEMFTEIFGRKNVVCDRNFRCETCSFYLSSFWKCAKVRIHVRWMESWCNNKMRYGELFQSLWNVDSSTHLRRWHKLRNYLPWVGMVACAIFRSKNTIPENSKVQTFPRQIQDEW